MTHLRWEYRITAYKLEIHRNVSYYDEFTIFLYYSINDLISSIFFGGGRQENIVNYEVFAYCLMSTHVHLLIREAEEPISLIMKRLLGSYSI